MSWQWQCSEVDHHHGEAGTARFVYCPRCMMSSPPRLQFVRWTEPPPPPPKKTARLWAALTVPVYLLVWGVLALALAVIGAVLAVPYFLFYPGAMKQ